MNPAPPRIAAVLAACVVTTIAAGCSSSGSGSSGSSPAVSSTVSSASSVTSAASSVTSAPASSAASSAQSSGATSTATGSGNLYVSLGDSYAAGYQATGPRVGKTTTNGFAYQVVTKSKAKGYNLTLANFGCAGATTTTILKEIGCKDSFLGPGATPYPSMTQAAAAEAYLRAHQGQVALVTVSIGGNDITACGLEANPTSCLTTALATVKTNLATLLTGLRAAAGPTTKIVGITYPDVLLGNALLPSAAQKQLAALSVLAFKSLINPALQAAYSAVNAGFVDVTTATGAYGSQTKTTTLAPYGKIPVPVAKICQLTYYCQYQDIHPRTIGYAIIADLVVATLPKR